MSNTSGWYMFIGATTSGQAMNINADTAATELALACMPQKMVYLSGDGGLRDGDGKIISVISHRDDYERLMQESWVKFGLKLKLLEIEKLLQNLPPNGTVAVTRPQDLLQELFSEAGAGTIVHKGTEIRVLESAEAVRDAYTIQRLTQVTEESFGKRLVGDYFNDVLSTPSFDALYVVGECDAIAVILKDEAGLYYMDKFMTLPSSQGSGLGNPYDNPDNSRDIHSDDNQDNPDNSRDIHSYDNPEQVSYCFGRCLASVLIFTGDANEQTLLLVGTQKWQRAIIPTRKTVSGWCFGTTSQNPRPLMLLDEPMPNQPISKKMR